MEAQAKKEDSKKSIYEIAGMTESTNV